jgi:hypothetical protein
VTARAVEIVLGLSQFAGSAGYLSDPCHATFATFATFAIFAVFAIFAISHGRCCLRDVPTT